MSARPLIAALAVLSSLAGCGDELGEFRDGELRPLDSRAAQQKARLAASLKVVEPGDRRDAKLLQTRLAPLEQTFAELAELDAPDDYDETYEQLVDANAEFAKQMRRFIAALRQGERRGMDDASADAKEALGAAQRAIQPFYE